MDEKPISAEAERFDAAKRQMAEAWENVSIQWKQVSPQNRPGANQQLHRPDWVALIAGLKCAGWNQTKLAKECGVTQQSISALASGATKSPSYELGMRLQQLAAPSGITVSTLSVLDVLELCERDFVFFGGCTMTDRPDLPLSPDTSWKADCSLVLAAIACAKLKLCGPEVAHIASECADCGTPPQTAQPSTPPKRGAELRGSRSPSGGSA